MCLKGSIDLFMKVGAIFLSTILVCSCAAKSNGELDVEFCPAKSESEVREILDLKEGRKLTIKELFLHLDRKGIKYESASNKYNLRKCSGYVSIDGDRFYKIYAGFDSTKSYTRNFLVVADSDGFIKIIETMFAYQAP